MIVTIGGIPVYQAVISDEETGMFKISLVDDPAVMSNFQAFDATRKMQLYAIQDEEKRLIRGCIMRADFPIYRRDSKMGEYYVIYKADEIRKMAEKYLLEGRQNDVNLMHQEGSDVDDVQMVQYFIKGDGIQVDGFDECADGSLFGEFHVTNDEVWQEIKAGTYRGFSLEGVFDLVPEQDKDEIQEIVDLLDGAFRKLYKPNKNTMSKLSRFKAALAKILQEFGNVTTDKGIISWDGEEDLKAGDAVYVEDEEGNRTPAEDGDYKTEDNKVIVVVDGKVAEIKDAEAEVDSEMIQTDKGKLEWDNEEEDLKEGDAVYITDEEGNRNPAPDGDYTTEDGKVIRVADGKVTEIVDDKAEVAPEMDETEDRIQELEDRIKELEAENAALKEENDSLKANLTKMKKMSAAKPAHQEVKQEQKMSKTGNKGLDRLARIMSAK
jgi:regulator of replication initiation timing